MATEYKIRLNITYTYDTPAGGSRSVLRMLPRTFQGQKLVAGAVGCLPEPDYRRDRVDFFGNAVTELAHADPLSEVSFRFDGRVSMTPREDYFDFSSPLARLNDEIAQQVSLASDAPHHYLGVSERIPLSEEIAAFAQDTVGPVLTALDAVLALSRGIHRTMTFDPTATDVTTTPVDAFRARSGVCQDYSHIMISGLRALGIPAGYVSGFLRTIPPEGKPRLEGADAMHAWVQAWCGAKAGWVQIDPTNDMIAGTDHIVVALGRDYADVAPVKGSLRAAGDHATLHKVDVIPL